MVRLRFCAVVAIARFAAKGAAVGQFHAREENGVVVRCLFKPRDASLRLPMATLARAKSRAVSDETNAAEVSVGNDQA